MIVWEKLLWFVRDGGSGIEAMPESSPGRRKAPSVTVPTHAAPIPPPARGADHVNPRWHDRLVPQQNVHTAAAPTESPSPYATTPMPEDFAAFMGASAPSAGGVAGPSRPPGGPVQEAQLARARAAGRRPPPRSAARAGAVDQTLARDDNQTSPTALSPEEVENIKAEERAHEAALVRDLDAFAERERDLDELTAMISSSDAPSPTKDVDDVRWDESQRKYLAPDKLVVEKSPPVALQACTVPGKSLPGIVQPTAAAVDSNGAWGDLELQLNDRERRILVDVLGAESGSDDLRFVTAAQVSHWDPT